MINLAPMFRKCAGILSLLAVCVVCKGQKKLPGHAGIIFTADSIASGNYKDVLSSFFQLAFNNLVQQRKEFRFTSNPFAVMARMNPNLLVDTNYVRYSKIRGLNFSFALNLDSAFRFNGFSSSISYALINQRDITVSREFVRLAYEGNQEFNRMNDSLNAFIARIDDQPMRSMFRDAATLIFRDSSKVRFNQLPDTLQNLLRSLAVTAGATNFLELVARDPSAILAESAQRSFRELREQFQNKILWVAGVADTSYKSQFAFSNVVFYTSFLKGVMKPAKMTNVELDIRSFLNMVDDPFVQGRDLKRKVFAFQPGVNLVLKTKDTYQSFFEFRLSGLYNRVVSGLAPGEDADWLMFNGTLRIRVFGDIWVPVEFRYDPRNGNVFGFLNVRANFNSFKKLLQ